MPSLSPDGTHSRRYAALLHDVMRAGGWLSEAQVGLRCELYGIDGAGLRTLAESEPPFIVPRDGGWSITAQGRRRITAWEQRERSEIRRAAGPAAAA